MRKDEMRLFLACALVMAAFLACGSDADPVSAGNEDTGSGNTSTGSADTVTDAETGNSEDHGDSGDYTWDGTAAVPIVLNGTSITSGSVGATVDGSKVTIVSAGAYVFSGSLADGQIVVNTEDKELVRVVLNGVDITSSSSAPVYVKKAEKVILVLADNSVNSLKDGASYVYDDAAEEEPCAAVFSKADLTIYGNGSLTVNGNFNDGISSKDGLLIASGTITVNAKDDGIRGKDYLVVEDGNVTVKAGGDGLKSDNETDATLGYVLIKNGNITITSGGDAINAQTDALISDGKLTITSGGGSSQYSSSVSAKGIKGVVSLIVDGGDVTINSADDGLHTNGNMIINGGAFSIATGDDGLHADAALTVNGGDINITKSYEGIESRTVITVNDGNIHITSSDDGLNVAGGNDGSGMRDDPFAVDANCFLYINGGHIAVDAVGDGVDCNGAIVMTDGDVLVNGPTSNANGALDHGSFKITGGLLIAVGSSGMAQAPGTSSTQCSVLLNFSSTQAAGSLFHVQTSEGGEVITFKPTKKYQSVALSTPALKKGSSYAVYVGGSSTGTVSDGLYLDGTYTAGTSYGNFSISNIVTTLR